MCDFWGFFFYHNAQSCAGNVLERGISATLLCIYVYLGARLCMCATVWARTHSQLLGDDCQAASGRLRHYKFRFWATMRPIGQATDDEKFNPLKLQL